MHPKIEETPVLIAGAGPAGLVAAATLARNGIGSVVVDSRSAPSRLPRANSINMAAMELFRSWGLEEAIREGDVDVLPMARQADTLADSDRAGVTIEVGFPSRAQSDVLGPAPPAAVPRTTWSRSSSATSDPWARRAWSGACRSWGSRTMETPCSSPWRIQNSDGSVWSRARYVVGADGIRSTVRDALGIEVESTGSLGERLAVLMRGAALGCGG